MCVEYALKKYLKDNQIKGWKVNSAGTIAKKEPIKEVTLRNLKNLGIKYIRHKQKKLTKRMLQENDFVIAMAKDHKGFIISKFNYKKVFLFNELAINKKDSILDIEQDELDNKTFEIKVKKTIKDIFYKTPILFQKLNNLK